MQAYEIGVARDEWPGVRKDLGCLYAGIGDAAFWDKRVTSPFPHHVRSGPAMLERESSTDRHCFICFQIQVTITV